MHGCTETDNKVVISCYKADLLDRKRNGLRHCQFDQVKFMLSKSALSREPLLTIIVYGGTHSSPRGVLHQSVGVKGGRLEDYNCRLHEIIYQRYEVKIKFVHTHFCISVFTYNNNNKLRELSGRIKGVRRLFSIVTGFVTVTGKFFEAL